MPVFIFFLFLVIAGFLGIVFLVSRRVFAARVFSAEEQKEKISGLPAFSDFIKENIINPLESFVADAVRPAVFKLGERFFRRFRILILKTENLLHRLSDHFRAKHIAIKNGNAANGVSTQDYKEETSDNKNEPSLQEGISKNSDFWNEMREVKNGSQNAESKKNSK